MTRKILALTVLVLLLLAAVPVLAQESRVDVYEGGQVKSVVFVVGRDEYFVNGQTPGIKMDAKPFIDQGRTFVPIRYLAYGLGVAPKDVGWEEKAKRVTLKLGQTTAELVVGSKTIRTNGQAKTMDVAPQLKAGRTYLPARWVAEALGYEVEWSPDDKLVICWPKGQPRPDKDIAKVKQYVDQNPPQPPQVPVSQMKPFTEPVGARSTTPEERARAHEVAQRAWDEAKPYQGTFYKWPEEGAAWPRATMFLNSVEDLKPNGIRFGPEDRTKSFMVIYDVWVGDDGKKVYGKFAHNADTPSAPLMYLVDTDMVPRYAVDQPLDFPGNPFVYGYDLDWTYYWDDQGFHRGWIGNKERPVSDFSGFLFTYGGVGIYVPNPTYKGGR